MNTREYRKVLVGALTSLTLCLSTAGIAEAAPLKSSSFSSEQVSYIAQDSTPAPVVSEDQLLAAFTAVEEIPDSVLKAGDAAAQSWLKARIGQDVYPGSGTVTTFGVVGCVSAIGLALVTNLPVFKITKIRTALKAAGGATTFVKNFMRIYDAQRKAKASFTAAVSQGVKQAAKAAAPEAQQLLIELFNLGNVYSACFE